MSLTVGTNSWVTVAEADTYFADSFGRSAWSGLSNAVKEQLLITSYRWIQQQRLFTIPATSTEEIVKQAQMELAWFVYNYKADYDKRSALYDGGVRKFKIEQFEEELAENSFPSEIQDMLSDYITKGSGSFPKISRSLNDN